MTRSSRRCDVAADGILLLLLLLFPFEELETNKTVTVGFFFFCGYVEIFYLKEKERKNLPTSSSLDLIFYLKEMRYFHPTTLVAFFYVKVATK